MGALNVRLLLLVCLSVGMTDNPSVNGDADNENSCGEDDEDRGCPVTPGEFKENHIIEAEIGRNITLQCNPIFSFSSTDDGIQWCKDRKQILLVMENNPTKDKDYKDRISYSTGDLKKGNASINLSNVKESDGGNYYCCIDLISKKKLKCIIQTVVVKNKDSGTKGLDQSALPSSSSDPPLIRTVMILPLVSVIAAIFGFF